jgi:hypothetical protein
MHLARVQRRSRLGAANDHTGVGKRLDQLLGNIERVSRVKKRTGTHAGLKDRDFHRMRSQVVDQSRDECVIHFGDLGQRRAMKRHATALGDEVEHLLAQSAFQHRYLAAVHRLGLRRQK